MAYTVTFFNTNVYPDLFNIPTSQNPILASQHLNSGNSYSLADVEITPILVNYTVPTSGLTVQNRGDTYAAISCDATPGASLPEVTFIECSYPNSMEELARAYKHLTPTVLASPHSALHDEASASFAADWCAATSTIQESHEMGANIVHKCSDIAASIHSQAGSPG